MGIMDLIKKMGERKKETSHKFKEMQEEDRLNTMLEERKKSSNRRELEKYMRDKEEEKIKETLGKIHKEQNKGFWKSENSPFKQKMNILHEDRPILKEKNIFTNQNHIPFMEEGGMFFK